MAFSFKLQKIYQLPSYSLAPLALLATIIRSDIAFGFRGSWIFSELIG